LRVSSRAVVPEAKRHTFGTIVATALPPADRVFARRATATAGKEAFHVAMGIATGLLVVAGVGGLALHGRQRTAVSACDCVGGQMAGQPRLVGAQFDLHRGEPSATPAGRGTPRASR
jgi:hypothetical protein